MINFVYWTVLWQNILKIFKIKDVNFAILTVWNVTERELINATLAYIIYFSKLNLFSFHLLLTTLIKQNYLVDVS